MKRTVLGLVLLLLATLCLACGTADSFNNAKTIGENIRTMMNIQDVAVALEKYRAEHGTYPSSESMSSLRTVLGSVSPEATIDRWGEPLLVAVTPESYTISSKGKDRTGDHEFNGGVTTPGHSITLRDGRFVQYYAKVEKTAAKIEQEIAAARK